MNCGGNKHSFSTIVMLLLMCYASCKPIDKEEKQSVGGRSPVIAEVSKRVEEPKIEEGRKEEEPVVKVAEDKPIPPSAPIDSTIVKEEIKSDTEQKTIDKPQLNAVGEQRPLTEDVERKEEKRRPEEEKKPSLEIATELTKPEPLMTEEKRKMEAAQIPTSETLPKESGMSADEPKITGKKEDEQVRSEAEKSRESDETNKSSEEVGIGGKSETSGVISGGDVVEKKPESFVHAEKESGERSIEQHNSSEESRSSEEDLKLQKEEKLPTPMSETLNKEDTSSSEEKKTEAEMPLIIKPEEKQQEGLMKEGAALEKEDAKKPLPIDQIATETKLSEEKKEQPPMLEANIGEKKEQAAEITKPLLEEEKPKEIIESETKIVKREAFPNKQKSSESKKSTGGTKKTKSMMEEKIDYSF